MVIKGLMDFDSSWYLCVLELLTKTQTKFKPYQDTRNQRTLNSETNSEDQKVSSEVDQNVLMVVQKLQKGVQKRTQNHLQKLCSEASEGRSEANP